MIRPLATALLLVAGACAVGGCGTEPYRDEPDDAVHLFLVQEMKGFDPAFTDEEIATVNVLNIYDTLYEYEYLARPFKLKPCLAEAMPEVSADQTTYTIRLKPGVVYFDDPCFPGGKGREVVASDVVFCLSRLLDARVVSPQSWVLEALKGQAEFHESTVGGEKNRTSYPAFAGVEALDARTVRIRLSAAQPWFPWILAMACTSVYPPEAVGYYGDGFRNHAVGTGPYRVRDFHRTSQVVLERNPTYREEFYPSEGSEEDRAAGLLADAGRRLPLADRIVATVFKETQPQWLFFMQGALDRTGIPKDNFGNAIDAHTMELLPELKDRGIRLSKDPRIEVIYECFNMEDPVVGAPAGEKGLAIRRAISLATDYAWATEHLYNNRVERVEGPLLKELFGFDPAFRNEWKPAPGETREQALARARDLLAKAGLAGGKGIPDLKCDVQEDETSVQHFEAFARDMRDIGITLRPYTVTWQQMMARVNSKQAQVWGISWGADYPDAQNFLQLFYGPNEAPGPNGSNYKNGQYDALYERAIHLPDGPEKAGLYQDMQKMVVRDCPWVFRYRRMNYNLDQPWLRGYRYNDVYPKYYKYCHVEAKGRREAIRVQNPANPLPLIVILVLSVGVVVTTLLLARSRSTAW